MKFFPLDRPVHGESGNEQLGGTAVVGSGLTCIQLGRRFLLATPRYHLDLSENPFVSKLQRHAPFSIPQIPAKDAYVSIIYGICWMVRLGDRGVSLLALAVQRRDCNAAFCPSILILVTCATSWVFHGFRSLFFAKVLQLRDVGCGVEGPHPFEPLHFSCTPDHLQPEERQSFAGCRSLMQCFRTLKVRMDDFFLWSAQNHWQHC